jgi:hypothetical protein
MASGNPNDESGGPKSPTGLLPLNAFGGKSPKVGDTCKFRVVQIYDDQVEVEYSHADESEDADDTGEGQMVADEEMTEYLD